MVLNGTYISVEPFHLFRYLDEQAFRYNNRKMNDGDRFDIVGAPDRWQAADVGSVDRQREPGLIDPSVSVDRAKKAKKRQGRGKRPDNI